MHTQPTPAQHTPARPLRGMKRLRRAFAGIALICACASTLPAQAYPHVPDTVDLSVLRVITDDFPHITTYFRAEKAGGGPLPSFSPHDLRILENGVECTFQSLKSVAEETPVHLALVMDRSASMMDEFIYRFDTIRGNLVLAASAMRKPGEPYPFDQAKAAILQLAKAMSWPRDGLLFVSFSDRVDPISPMRRDTSQLAPALRKLRATGSTAFYDAIMAALDTLPAYGGLRAVIALTDGTDNASEASAADVVRRAQAVQAPVYVVGLGNVARDTLLHIAAATRGACYFLDHGSLLAPVYRDINRRVRSVYAATYLSPNEPELGRDYHLELRLRGDTLCMRGHASRYRVPDAIALQWQGERNAWRMWVGGLLFALALGLAFMLYRRSQREARQATALVQAADLPELLPPPRAFPNPSTGQVTVRVELSGDDPSAFLLLLSDEGQPLRRYELSGHQAWLDLDLSELPPGTYILRVTDGQAISAPMRLLLQS